VLLAERTGKPLDEVLDLIEYDHVMDAQEALALGLIDVVITKPGEGFMAGANESAAAEPTSVNAADAASNSSDAA
jgi:enoyl-CoA hydratase/carnithine racemase